MAAQLPWATIVPEMNSGGNLTATTSATGANFVAFASVTLKQITIVNNSGTKIEYVQDGAGAAVPVFDQSSFTILGIDNASQISIRRVDQSGTQVTVAARWEN